MESKSYVVDISSPKCWNNIVLEYKPQILQVLNTMRPMFSSYLSYASAGLVGYRLFGGIIMYEQEILEIATILEISFIECLLFQLTYEFCSACTTAIIKSDNEYVCIRTLDWENDLLKTLTIQIKVVDKNKELFNAITWSGFVGIFTGIKPNDYVIALNYKRSEVPNFTKNITSLFKGYYPNAFFIRDILTHSDADSAYSRIRDVYLIAPAYYTFMSNTVKCVFIRTRETAKIIHASCVQTNCDDLNGLNIMWSHERLAYMNKIKDQNLPLESLIKHISYYPVNNEHTIYTVIMSLKDFLYFKISK